MVGEFSLGGQEGAKLWDAHRRVNGYLIVLCLVVVRHKSKDVVEVRFHTARVKVHRRGDGQFGICVVVDKNYDNDVIANVSLSLQLVRKRETHTQREREREREREKENKRGEGEIALIFLHLTEYKTHVQRQILITIHCTCCLFSSE